jgi:hypothetical protein
MNIKIQRLKCVPGPKGGKHMKVIVIFDDYTKTDAEAQDIAFLTPF